VGTKSVSWLFNAVLDDFCKIVIAEASILASFETTEDPLLGWGLCEVVTKRLQRLLVPGACGSKGSTCHVDSGHHLGRHVIDVS
jgi:hypothetical protein